MTQKLMTKKKGRVWFKKRSGNLRCIEAIYRKQVGNLVYTTQDRSIAILRYHIYENETVYILRSCHHCTRESAKGLDLLSIFIIHQNLQPHFQASALGKDLRRCFSCRPSIPKYKILDQSVAFGNIVPRYMHPNCLNRLLIQ